MKDINECRERLRGIFNITVTPFDASGAINYPALRENIERVIGLGYDGLLIGGTYGEFPVMTVEERRELFHEVMGCVDDRVAVMLCSASSDPRDAREPEKPGKLRLMYEANPMSFIIEQAGGAATNGTQRILDIKPENLHQRVAVFLGSKQEVERITGYHAE